MQLTNDLHQNKQKLLSLFDSMYDDESLLSTSKLGAVSIRQFGSRKFVGALYVKDNLLVYSQLHKPENMLRVWNSWTIDRIIFNKLPEDTVLRFFCTNNTLYEYTKQSILTLKRKTEEGQVLLGDACYDERKFTGHEIRIILPVSISRIVQINDIIKDKEVLWLKKLQFNQ